MNLLARALALTGILLGGVTAGGGAFAQKPGGTLKVYFFDSPGSMSIHEESTIAGQGPAQGVFNNLVMYDQHIAQTSIKTIVPDPAREMRQHPIGTGPFKFVEFKPNEYIKVVRNPDYWKKERPYLDGIDWTIIKNQATGQLAFLSGQFDITSPYFFQVPLINDTQKQDPQAICKLVPSNVNRNVMINRAAPPFNNPELRRAVALTIDRRAFIDTLTQGKGDVGGALLPPPEGIWGRPPGKGRHLPGSDPDVEKSRAAGRER